MGVLTYKGKTVESAGVLGLGKSNTGVMDYFHRHYPDVPITVRCDKLTKHADFCGDDALSDLYEELLFISPSVRRDRRELTEAMARGVTVTTDAEFFCECFGGDIFAISGSDGKSTTTALTAMLLSRTDGEVPAIGNIGVAMTPCLDGNYRAVAAELSSFQLMDLEPITARAFITNVTPNHLNWHKSYDEYVSAKENLMKRARERVFNLDCPVCRLISEKYGADIVCSDSMTDEEVSKISDARIRVTRCGDGIAINGKELLRLCDIKCASRHNVKNLIAAIALTYGYTDGERITDVARKFNGLAHRCELIGKFNGITYINSSIDSSPKRTVTTLRSLNGRMIVILGGRSKGLGFGELAPVLSEHARLAVLTGENGREIEDSLNDSTARIYVRDFEDAVKHAITSARSGDTVILSPASTSFDSFSSFEERGEKFKEIILNHYKGF